MISRFFIDRPIFASVISIVITLVGAIAVFYLPIAQYPQITPPSVTVAITYPGASAQIVADTVGAPIEQQVNGVEGMLYMSSQMGNDGSYTLTVTFDLGTNLNTALVMVQNRVALAMPQLPTQVQLQGITIKKKTPDILMIISFISPDGRYDDVYLSNFATIYVRDEIFRVPGVSDITYLGQRDYSIRAWLDPQQLAARNMTAGDVVAAVATQSIQAAPGQIGNPPAPAEQSVQMPIDTLGRLSEPEQFGDIIVKIGRGSPIPGPSAAASAGSGPSTSSPGMTPSMPGVQPLASLSSAGTNGLTTASSGGMNIGPIGMGPTGIGSAGGEATNSGMTGSSGAMNNGTTGVTSASIPVTGSTSISTARITSAATSALPTLATSGLGVTTTTRLATGGATAAGGGTTSTVTATSTDASTTGGTAPVSQSVSLMPQGIVSATSGTSGGLPPAQSASIVRLRDVARVEMGAQNYNMSSTFDGLPSVGLAVRQLPGTNALDVADQVRARMEELRKRFPDDIDFQIAYDITPYIRESVQDVVQTLFEAIALVGLVVMVFLQSWRACIVPLIAVPVAIIGTFAVMLAIGFSLNNISLFGLVLAIGIVVDDAIVVVENVERWLDQGLEPREATRKAMEEVTGPVIAVALVLCAVFVPCAFISGITGQFFRQFAVTISVSTVFSAINSLTLSPALAAILLKRKRHGETPHPESKTAPPHAAGHSPSVLRHPLRALFHGFNVGFERTTAGYAWAVGKLLRVNLLVLAGYAGLIVLTWWVFERAPTGFVPDQDQGRLIVGVQMPDATSLQQTQDAVAQIEKVTKEIAGVAHVITVSGLSFVQQANSSNYASLFVVLDPFEKRKTADLRDTAIMARLRRACREKVKDAEVSVFGAPPIPGLSVAGGFKLMIEDRGGLGLSALQQQTDALVQKLQAEPGLTGVASQFRSNTPQLFMDIDRAKVESLGVSFLDLDQTLQVYLGSSYVNSFNAFGRHWQVTLQADGDFRNRTDHLNLLQVRNKTGQMVPLSTLVDVREIGGPVFVTRYDLYTAAPITGGLRADVSSGEAIETINRISKQSLPLTMGTEWTELMFMQIRAGNTAMYVFGLAVVCVFLALAALYESWALPLAVILVVPLCLLCSLVGVLITHTSVNIFVQIGLVVLVGLACKNAILIVEFANLLMQQGRSRLEATQEASRLRLRPILMTSLAFILGTVPLVIATGAGAEMRRSLGTAVFSGMIGVTLFGIFLTPVFFYVIRGIGETRLFSAEATRWIGTSLMCAGVGAAIAFLLGRIGIFGGPWSLAIGAAAGLTAALLILSTRVRQVHK